MDRAVLGEAAQVKQAGRPAGAVEHLDDGFPEGALLARGDERRAQEHLVVRPALHDPHRQAGITLVEHEREQADQGVAAADLEQADLPAAGERAERGLDEPVLGEGIGLGGDPGERGPSWTRTRISASAGTGASPRRDAVRRSTAVSIRPIEVIPGG